MYFGVPVLLDIAEYELGEKNIVFQVGAYVVLLHATMSKPEIPYRGLQN